MKEIGHAERKRIQHDAKRGIIKYLYSEKMLTENQFSALMRRYGGKIC